MDNKCVFCGKIISDIRLKRHAKYCSSKCGHEKQTKDYRDKNPYPTCSRNTSGAIGEYRVIIDLLNKHYDVFQSCTPNGSCDLAVLKDGKLFRIEVTVGRYTPNGKWSYATHNSERYDIIAIVFPDKISYVPELVT